MRVLGGYNPYAYQQQKGKTKAMGFADMVPNMTKNKSDKTEAAKNGCQVTGRTDLAVLNMRLANPRRYHEKQLRPDKEWLNAVGQPNAESKGDKELTGPQILFLQTNYYNKLRLFRHFTEIYIQITFLSFYLRTFSRFLY